MIVPSSNSLRNRLPFVRWFRSYRGALFQVVCWLDEDFGLFCPLGALLYRGEISLRGISEADGITAVV